MRQLISILCLWFYIVSLQASDHFNFRNLDMKSGLSNNFVHHIMRDSYGYMWIATENGLNRFDGYQFVTYTIMQHGAYSDNIPLAYEDADKNIWIKGPEQYYYYNRERDCIDDDIESLLASYHIKGIPSLLLVDNDRNLWCRTDSTLHYYNFLNRKHHTFPCPQTNELIDITCRAQRPFLLFANGSIARIDIPKATITMETQTLLQKDKVYHIYLDSSNQLWTYGLHATGLNCYDTNHRKWTSFSSKKELDGIYLTTVMDDANGNLWIGTDNRGILIYSPGQASMKRISTIPGNHFSLPDNHINCFYKDHMNTIWIGTAKQGVAVASLNRTTFNVYQMSDRFDVKTIQEDRHGNLWIGFDGYGLICYNPHDNTHISYTSSQKQIPSDIIVCSCLDNRDRMWFGSFGNGAFYIKDQQITPIHYQEKGMPSNKLNMIRCITSDAMGTMWFGTFVDGLYALNPDNSFAAYTMSNSPIGTNTIIDLCYDTIHELLYIGTSSGLYAMLIHERKIERITSNIAGTQTLQDDYINCLYLDSRGLLWIGTRSGLAILNHTTDCIQQIDSKYGLSHNDIRGITEDRYHNIWVSTSNGLNQIKVSSRQGSGDYDYTCYAYYGEDGLGNQTFNNHAITHTSRGEILVGAVKALIQFVPLSSITPEIHHQVKFTSLSVGNQQMKVGMPTSEGSIPFPRNIQLIDKITMSYADANFSIGVSSMNFLDSHKLIYQYRLGKEYPWIKMENNHIQLNRLSPGYYELQVREYHANDADKYPLSTLHIVVEPPFYLSNIAYLFYVLLTISVFLFILWRVHKRHQHSLVRQQYDLQVKKQLEMDEAKMVFFTNVSHDLRTPLSLIISPLEKMLSSSNLDDEHKKELKLMQRNADVLLNEVDQLLDFRRLDKQRNDLMLSYGNFSDFVKEVCQSFSESVCTNGITLTLNMADTNIEMMFDSNKMRRVLLNLLSNAMKYNQPNGTIEVTLRKENDRAQLSVADSGIGIRKENRNLIFERFFREQNQNTTQMGNGIGLHIVKEYVTMHKGSIIVEDNTPQGSMFIVTLPIVKGESTSKADSEKVTPTESQGLCHNESTTLLIVEDNNDFRTFLVDCLKESYTIFSADNGQEALEVLSLNSVNIVISDVMMPVMDGLQLCQSIKTDIRYSHIPVILLTARTADEHVISGLREGADDYITKPFNLEILRLRIENMLQWTRNNHTRFQTAMEVSPREITVSSIDEQLITKAIDIVEKNMDNSEFSVEELSTEIGVSRSGLYKKLMSITGKSPVEFIRILRLKRAKQLLEQSQLPISQIAYQVGISPKLFSKYFKEEFGSLPSEFQKKRET